MPAEGHADILDHRNDLVGVLGRNLDIDRVHIRKAFKENRFALHHRLGRQRAKIAQSENRRAVRDHRNEIALRGIVVGEVRIAGDGQHRRGYTRGVGKRQVALCRHGLGRHDRDLARRREFMERERLVVREGASLGVAHGASIGPVWRLGSLHHRDARRRAGTLTAPSSPYNRAEGFVASLNARVLEPCDPEPRR